MDGGPAGDGLVVAAGFAAGLSHVSKKSSVEAAGVFDARGVSSNPSIWIPCGFLPSALLEESQSIAHFCASASIRRASSSLYNPACRDVYLPLASEFCGGNNACPPCFEKKSAIWPFPPTFIARSWVSDHESRLVDLASVVHIDYKRIKATHRTKEICTPRLRCTDEQSRQR